MNKETLTKLIHKELEREIKEIIEKKIISAQKEVEEAIKKETDRIALELLNFYSVERMGENLVITVRKEFDK